MNPFEKLLEPAATQTGKANPDASVATIATLSAAISAKRQADALEKIAFALEQTAEAMNVNGEWTIPATLARMERNLKR